MEFFPLSGSCREICQLEERDLLQRVGKCSEDESSSAVDCTLSLGFSSSASTDVDVKSMGWKKGGHAEIFVRRCLMCGTTQTPLWRNGPNGAKSLCNACGIRFKKEEKRANLMRGTSMFHSKKPKPSHHTAAQDPLLSGP